MGGGSSTAAAGGTPKKEEPQLSPLELAMKALFTSIDTDNNGTVDFAELLTKLEKDNQLNTLLGTEGWSSESCVDYLKTRFDLNGDGKISFPEFAKIFVLFLIREEATQLFNETDADNSGQCSKEELTHKLVADGNLEKFTQYRGGTDVQLNRDIFGRRQSKLRIARDGIIETLDTDHDGNISRDEFLAFAEKKFIALEDGSYDETAGASMGAVVGDSDTTSQVALETESGNPGEAGAKKPEAPEAAVFVPTP
mmetsp:Transcript_87270/g.174612  ORF Transcript_87270/g.174612 Transcript_87270/m.174612 type:complete len:253 (+) Transcript_87270:62-820(+)